MAFINRNVCKTFSVASASFSTPSTKVKLADQECSEVVILSHGTTGHYIYDSNNPTVPFKCPLHEEMVFRGITNSNQVSATGANDGELAYRTQFFSNFPEIR